MYVCMEISDIKVRMEEIIVLCRMLEVHTLFITLEIHYEIA